MSDAARALWIDLAAPNDPVIAEQIRRNIAELESDLARPGATRLERLLAGRVATCHLMAATADALAGASLGGADPAARRESLDRQRSATGTLLAAARALALCQKLLTPPPSPLELLRPQAERAPGRRAGRRAGVRVGIG
jgi:hypothetical protein